MCWRLWYTAKQRMRPFTSNRSLDWLQVGWRSHPPPLLVDAVASASCQGMLSQHFPSTLGSRRACCYQHEGAAVSETTKGELELESFYWKEGPHRQGLHWMFGLHLLLQLSTLISGARNTLIYIKIEVDRSFCFINFSMRVFPYFPNNIYEINGVAQLLSTIELSWHCCSHSCLWKLALCSSYCHFNYKVISILIPQILNWIWKRVKDLK
jgi:hypothetical protein